MRPPTQVAFRLSWYRANAGKDSHWELVAIRAGEILGTVFHICRAQSIQCSIYDNCVVTVRLRERGVSPVTASGLFPTEIVLLAIGNPHGRLRRFAEVSQPGVSVWTPDRATQSPPGFSPGDWLDDSLVIGYESLQASGGPNRVPFNPEQVIRALHTIIVSVMVCSCAVGHVVTGYLFCQEAPTTKWVLSVPTLTRGMVGSGVTELGLSLLKREVMRRLAREAGVDLRNVSPTTLAAIRTCVLEMTIAIVHSMVAYAEHDWRKLIDWEDAVHGISRAVCEHQRLLASRHEHTIPFGVVEPRPSTDPTVMNPVVVSNGFYEERSQRDSCHTWSLFLERASALFLNKRTFCSVVLEAGSDIKSDLRFTGNGVILVQHAVEAYLLSLFESTRPRGPPGTLTGNICDFLIATSPGARNPSDCTGDGPTDYLGVRELAPGPLTGSICDFSIATSPGVGNPSDYTGDGPRDDLGGWDYGKTVSLLRSGPMTLVLMLALMSLILTCNSPGVRNPSDYTGDGPPGSFDFRKCRKTAHENLLNLGTREIQRDESVSARKRQKTQGPRDSEDEDVSVISCGSSSSSSGGGRSRDSSVDHDDVQLEDIEEEKVRSRAEPLRDSGSDQGCLEVAESPKLYNFDYYLQGDPDEVIKHANDVRPPRPIITEEDAIRERKNKFPFKNDTEIKWFIMKNVHRLPLDTSEDIKKFMRDPTTNPADLPTEYREKQLVAAMPVIPVMVVKVGPSDKELQKRAKLKRRKQREKAKRAKAREKKGEVVDDSSSESDVDRAPQEYKVPFADFFDTIKMILKWPGTLEHWSFLPHMSIGGRVGQLVNGRMITESIRYTAESLQVPKIKERIGHGHTITYKRGGGLVMGEVVGIFRVSDDASWEDVIGKDAAERGGLADALRRMKEAGGGPGGNPESSVTMAFRMRPYSTLVALKGAGTVDFQGPEEKEDPDECFAMFDVEHVVLPCHVVEVTKVWQSREAAAAAGVNDNFWFCERSVMSSSGENGTTKFTLFDSEDLPKPLYRLFDSAILKRKLRRKPAHIPVLRAFFSYFTDSAQVFSRVWHSTLNCFVASGNVPMHISDLLRSIMPTSCVPPGANKSEAFRPFFSRVRQLEDGVYLDLGPKIGMVFLVGGIGILRLDMPEAALYCSTMQQTAGYGCRRCLTHKLDFDKVKSPIEVAKVVRTFQGMKNARQQAEASATSATNLKNLLREKGLAISEGFFQSAGLRTDPFRQAPHDNMHLTKLGFDKKFLSAVFCCMTDDAIIALNLRVAKFPTFPTWGSKLPPVKLTSSKKDEKQTVNMTATAMGRWCACLPLIMRGWLKLTYFKSRSRAGLSVDDVWLTRVKRAMALVARSNAVILALHVPFVQGDLYKQSENIYAVVSAASAQCYELWPANFHCPTQHCGSHYPEAFREIGPAPTYKTGKYENKHKQMISGLEGYNGVTTPEELMMIKETLRSAILFLSHGGGQHLHGDQFGQAFIRCLQGDFIQSMLARTSSTKTYVGGTEMKQEDVQGSVNRDEHGKDEMASPSTVSDTVRGKSVAICDVTIDEACAAKIGAGCRTEGNAFRYVELISRPNYCRRIGVERHYTVNMHDSQVAKCRVALVEDIIEFPAATFWVHVNWVEPVEVDPAPGSPSRPPVYAVDKETSLTIVRLSGVCEIRPLKDILEPRHVVHLCDENCTTSGAGFDDGKHSDKNEYLDNEFFTF